MRLPILLVDPDVSAVAPLERADYHVCHVETAAAAREQLDSVAMVVLDLDLPDEDGVILISEMREQSQVPILVCTARDARDQVLALKFGADMAVQKPIEEAELVARVRAVLRRTYMHSDTDSPMPPVLRCGPIVINIKRREVAVDETRVRLTPTEFRMLQALCMETSHFLSRAQLCQAVWWSTDETLFHTLDVHQWRLRRKLAAVGVGYMLETVRGEGYQLADPKEDLLPKGD